MTHPIFTDVLVVGAGPVGLFSVFQCGMNKLSCHVVDALDMVGGQCSALYPEKPIYDIPAHPAITGQELTDKLFKQAAPFRPVYHLSQQVTHLVALSSAQKSELVDTYPSDHARAALSRFYLKTSNGTEFYTSAVIIAAGVGAFGPNRPPLDHLEMFENSGPGVGVHYYVTSRDAFRGKNVVIAGGGDSAVDWAISLADVAKRVTVVHRRPKFRCAPTSSDQLHKLASVGAIDLVIPYQLHQLSGTSHASKHTLTHVTVQSMDGATKSIEADALLPFFGLSVNLGPILEWGLGMDSKYITIDQGTGATNIEGIYAVGDVATYSHKHKLILCGFAEAAGAAHAIRRLLHPDEAIHFEHSTTMGVPGQASAVA